MESYHKVLVAAGGIALAIAGGVWGAWGPIAALSAASEVIWVRRLAMVAALGAIVGAIGAMRGHGTAGAGLSLVSGIVLLGAGSAGAGIVVVLGSTLVVGTGHEPDPAAMREALRNAAR